MDLKLKSQIKNNRDFKYLDFKFYPSLGTTIIALFDKYWLFFSNNNSGLIRIQK